MSQHGSGQATALLIQLIPPTMLLRAHRTLALQVLRKSIRSAYRRLDDVLVQGDVIGIDGAQPVFAWTQIERVPRILL